ncbi:TSL-kinase interacting protein 1 [Quillaja saponaria]|uniref:TSL-kinase interacting protein 1 n=1 Tax=Quillaja saponaria TaxID=32244 RepID=A0AAD7PIV3_QUISA|nr:TSL-kinase interacting protein 1 [Quillaja saponaria]
MQAESQVSLDCEAHLHTENISVRSGDSGIIFSTVNDVLLQQPVGKKPTRQWAAWTRQEEESFFTALRQVGKNFEKITSRVQSKNKDQVRHYYYRLVRRMNKLLGPGLCLDAKNSNDTNAAMLRWWSLLEKYSCKASKLHLKPRRFKIFIEALEHQLLKDRKKNVRKRSMQGENCPPAATSSVSNQSRVSGNDAQTVKLVLVDSQNIQKLGSTKASLKRNVNTAVNHNNNKGESTTMKPARQRRKTGMVSTAAYRKWEKAAIAGVSLVADAAEHLERTITGKEVNHGQDIPGQKCSYPAEDVLPSLASPSHYHVFDSSVNNSMKLKLQLFPADESTRRALEMDKHNPHLELTLSTRKKISSVVEHLNRKWGSSRIAIGELMLFPYCVQRESLGSYQKWAQDSILSAADVYTMIGSPPVFRLRYGWFSNTELGLQRQPAPITSSCILGESNINASCVMVRIVDSAQVPAPSTNNQSMDLHEGQETSVTINPALGTVSTDVPSNMNSVCLSSTIDLEESSNPAPDASRHEKDSGNEITTRRIDNMDDLRISTGTALSAGEWADSLTNVSVGDLLSGVSHDRNANCIDSPVAGRSQCSQQIAFCSDSFDAAIAAHISRNQGKIEYQPTFSLHTSSMLDAEETCDAFSFIKDPVLYQDGPGLSGGTSLGVCKQVTRRSSQFLGNLVGELCKEEMHVDDSQGDLKDCQSDPETLYHPAKDLGGLADMYWPDSLSPLDLDMPSSKYHSEGLILSDSLSGLNRLIASSLDAFHNCSFFGIDKEAPSTVEARESAAFSDFKVGS